MMKNNKFINLSNDELYALFEFNCYMIFTYNKPINITDGWFDKGTIVKTDGIFTVKNNEYYDPDKLVPEKYLDIKNASYIIIGSTYDNHIETLSIDLLQLTEDKVKEINKSIEEMIKTEEPFFFDNTYKLQTDNTATGSMYGMQNIISKFIK